jgi:DNA-binding Lrp family transcriptional regulator
LRPARDDVRRFLTRLAPYVESEGARNLNRISRELTIPYPTLRFRMMRLKDQGISIVPAIEAQKLGLERIRVQFSISNEVTNYKAFFGGLYQAAGLHYYARTLLSQVFDSEFMVPSALTDELRKLLKALEEMKIIYNSKMRKLLWKEVIMMKTQFYDYENGEWDVDFPRLVGNPSMFSYAAAQVEKIDHHDLSIVKALQIDPWANLNEIAKELGITDSDVAYHLGRHVFGRKLVSGFRLKWIGTRNAWAKHSIGMFTLVFPECSNEDSRHAMSVITSIPFAWNHMRAEDGTYLAELLVPTSQIPDTMHYLSENLRSVGISPEAMYVDWTCVSNYTIPYQMHDKERGWVMNAERSLGHVLQMIEAYKE